MKTFIASGFIVTLLGILGPGQVVPIKDGPAVLRSPLDQRVRQFELNDAILRDGVAELSSNRIEGLHLGIEEILRENINDDPRTQNPHFSLRLENKTVREILDALCESDARYVWSSDSLSINVYPKASVGNATYLPNHELERISLNNITDPDQALTPLSKLMPNEQVGYMGFGDIQYERPWTVTFEHITVRRMINRLAEHLGPQSLWIWQGSRSERMFTFLKWGPASRSD